MATSCNCRYRANTEKSQKFANSQPGTSFGTLKCRNSMGEMAWCCLVPSPRRCCSSKDGEGAIVKTLMIAQLGCRYARKNFTRIKNFARLPLVDLENGRQLWELKRVKRRAGTFSAFANANDIGPPNLPESHAKQTAKCPDAVIGLPHCDR